MKYIALFMLVVVSAPGVKGQDPVESARVQQVIARFFEGLSERNLEKMKANVTPDFSILEHGVVWTLDTLEIYAREPLPSGFKRINTFDFFQTEVKRDMAFVSYHNAAEIDVAGQQRRTVHWLESAVLIKQGKQWKVKMLHSTRLPQENKNNAPDDMIYITQLIFVKEGKEEVFHQFEEYVLPLLEKHGGKIVYRLRPSDDSFISAAEEKPYEIHFVSFQSESGLESYIKDDARLKYLHLKDESVRSIVLIKGARMQ